MINFILGFIAGALVAVIYAAIKPSHFQKLRRKVLGWIRHAV